MRHIPSAILFVFFLLPALPSFSQEVSSEKVKLVVVKDVNAVKKRIPELKAYTKALLARDLTFKVIDAMEFNGFERNQILETLKGPAFRTFLEGVVESKDIDRRIELTLVQELDPERIEAKIQKIRQEENAARQARAKLLYQHLLRNRQIILAQSKVKREPSYWDRLWRRARRYLLE